MLNILRKRRQSIIIQVVVVAIAGVFVLWGAQSFNQQANLGAVATVNGEDISIQDFQLARDRLLNQYKQQFGGQVPDALIQGLNIDGQALDQLIQQELLRQGALELGFGISDATIQGLIEAEPAFQKEGQFNFETYEQVLGMNQRAPSTPTLYETALREELLLRELIDAVGDLVLVPPGEVEHWLAYTDRQLRIAYQSFAATDFEDKVEVKEEELAAWYGQHKADYLAPAQIKLDYLWFPFSEEVDKVEVQEDAIQDSYDKDLENYQKPEQRHARHILIRVPQDADEAKRAAAEVKAKEILERLKQGEDFAALATEVSDDTGSKDNGGDLGFFTRGRMVPEFEEAVFGATVGQLVGPVQSPYGYHLIKVEEVQPARTQPLEEVRDAIVKQLQEEEGGKLAFERASNAYEGIMNLGSLEKFRQQSEERVTSTELFSQEQPPEGPLASASALKAAFALNKGELSSLIETEQGYLILYVVDKQEPAERELAEVRPEAEAAYRKERADALARAAAEQRLSAVRETGTLEGDGVETSELIKRTGEGAGEVPYNLVQAAFRLGVVNALPEEVLSQGDVYYLFQVKESVVASGEEATDRAALKEQLLGSQKKAVIGSLLKNLQEEGKIRRTNVTTR